MGNAAFELPEAYEHLRKCDEWALPTSAARVEKRQAGTKEELKKFYSEISPDASAILDYLNGFSLGEMPPGPKFLFDLMLSFAEIALYVEWFDGDSASPIVPNHLAARVEIIYEPEV